jgi:hypothetical protein
MSKKSRRRNKALLAIAGLAGAAALANRKPKQSSTEENSGKGGDGPAAIARRKANKDTTTKLIAKPDTTPIVKPDTQPKKTTTSIANRSSRGAGDYPDYKAAETRVDGTLIKGRSNAQRITPFSPAQGNRAKTTEEMLRNSDTRGYKSGGRAGYKHGGSTGSSKSSGAAKRGISPILMKGRK